MIKGFQKILGYSWAVLALVIVLAAFIGNLTWAKQLVKVTGVTISPWCTGGEEIATLDRANYQTVLHRPVFDGLIGERREGFVQVNLKAYVGEELPEMITEEIDYDRDGANDFTIVLNTKTDQATLQAASERVVKVEGVYRMEKERAVRVKLKK
jgi:hypothetical protein